MHTIWYAYLAIMLFMFTFGIYSIYKHKKILGTLHIVLPIEALLFYFMSAVGSDNEFEIFYKQLQSGNIAAYIALLLFVCMGALLIYDIYTFIRKNKKTPSCD